MVRLKSMWLFMGGELTSQLPSLIHPFTDNVESSNPFSNHPILKLAIAHLNIVGQTYHTEERISQCPRETPQVYGKLYELANICKVQGQP